MEALREHQQHAPASAREQAERVTADNAAVLQLTTVASVVRADDATEADVEFVRRVELPKALAAEVEIELNGQVERESWTDALSVVQQHLPAHSYALIGDLQPLQIHDECEAVLERQGEVLGRGRRRGPLAHGPRPQVALAAIREAQQRAPSASRRGASSCLRRRRRCRVSVPPPCFAGATPSSILRRRRNLAGRSEYVPLWCRIGWIVR